ncbi:MAG TPA: hypothetical protein VF556_04760 [Pyrinomonadaceae bacterium]
MTINNVTITRGNGTGQSITALSGRGGAIFNNDGNLTLNRSVIRDNSTTHGGGFLVSVAF